MGRCRLILTIALALAAAAGSATAQKPVIGQRAPEVKIASWLTAKPVGGRAQLLVFFHSSSDDASKQLATLDGYARKYGSKIYVTVLAREAEETVKPLVLDTPRDYYVALDDNGRTFSNFGVQYVPFSVLIDWQGKVLWFGNPARLDVGILEKLPEINLSPRDGSL